MPEYYKFLGIDTPYERAELSPEAAAFVAAKDPAFAAAQRRALRAALNGDASRLLEIRRLRAQSTVDLSAIDVSEKRIGAGGYLRVKIYAPKARALSPRKILLYIHGGGWTINAPETADRFCRDFAANNGAVVVSPEYRLAPEHPYPAANIDVFETYAWLLQNAASIGGNPREIFPSGDSAGGHLAFAAALEIKSRALPAPAGIMAIYPAADLQNFSSPSYKFFGQNRNLDADVMELFAALYAPAPEAAREASLLNKDLRGLPRSLILVSECDVLRDDGQALFRALSDAGVKARLVCVGGAVHAYLTQEGMDGAYALALRETSEFFGK